MEINQEQFQRACEVAREKVALSRYLVDKKLTYKDVGEDSSMIRCPFPDHNDSAPSFSYDDEKEVFNCFGCGRSGDVVNLHYYMNSIEDERYSRLRAVRELSREFKFEIPDMTKQEMKVGKVNKFKRVRVDRGKQQDEFYKEKIRGLEPKLKLAPESKRLVAYRKIDDMCLGYVNPRETFKTVRNALKGD